MPKKTKFKKILAAYRNKLKQEQLQSIPSDVLQKNTQKSSLTSSVYLQKNDENKDTNIITEYFKKDFIKSIFIIIGVITLELILYFVSMNNNLRSVFKFIP